MSKQILVGGFADFGRHRNNPAANVALPALESKKGVDTVRIPVSFQDALPALRDAYDEHRHDAVLLLGLGAQASDMVKVETEARNLDVCLLFADGHGQRRLGFIEPNADWRRPATIDTEAVRSGLERAAIRARFSRDAGTYVCNHLFYQALGAIDVPVGFIHLGRGMSVEQIERMAHSASDVLLDDASLL